MTTRWHDYQFKEGDHWIDPILSSLATITKENNCSLEVHILYGITKGIKVGNITLGNTAYRNFALSATVNGSHTELKNEIRELARMGLFVPTTLGGLRESEFLERSGICPTIPDTHDPDNHPATWQESLAENLYFLDPEGSSPELNLLQGIVQGTYNGTVRYGDPAYARFLLDAIKSSKDPTMHCSTLETFAEIGFFGSELLLGCEADRSTAVGRLK